MVAGKKKTIKIDFFVADLPILETLRKEVDYIGDAEALHFLFNIMAQMSDQIKELKEKECDCIKDKKEGWKQGRLRSDLPFYG